MKKEKDIEFPVEIDEEYEEIPIYPGLWNNWIENGYQLFYEEMQKELKKYLYESTYPSDYYIDFSFMKKFIFYILKFSDVDKAFMEAGGLKTRWGIIFLRYKIDEYHKKHGTIPTPLKFKTITDHLTKGDLKRLGYSTWKECIAKNHSKSIGRFRLQKPRSLLRKRPKKGYSDKKRTLREKKEK